MIFALVCCIQLLTICRGQNAYHVRYDNYSSVDFENSTGVFVPTVYHCLSLSNVAPFTNGVSYFDGTKTCKVLTSTNNEILVRLRANVGWVTYVKNITSQYKLIFKIDSNYSNVNTNSHVYKLFTGIFSTYTTVYNSTVSSLVKGQSCGCAYRNPIIDSLKPAKFIKLEYIQNRRTVVSLTFDANNKTISSWFDVDYLVSATPYSTSYLRLKSDGYDSATVGTFYTGRSFEIYGDEGFCKDYYFIVASVGTTCGYEDAPWPKLIYTSAIPAVPSREPGAEYADFMTISALYYERVTIMT